MSRRGVTWLLRALSLLIMLGIVWEGQRALGHRRSLAWTGTRIQAHASAVMSMAFSHDGSLLATAGYDQVRVWRVATGQPQGIAPIAQEAARLPFHR